MAQSLFALNSLTHEPKVQKEVNNFQQNSYPAKPICSLCMCVVSLEGCVILFCGSLPPANGLGVSGTPLPNLLLPAV